MLLPKNWTKSYKSENLVELKPGLKLETALQLKNRIAKIEFLCKFNHIF